MRLDITSGDAGWRCTRLASEARWWEEVAGNETRLESYRVRSGIAGGVAGGAISEMVGCAVKCY